MALAKNRVQSLLPVEIVDVVEWGGLSKAHSSLPDVFTAVQRLHVLNRVLYMTETHSETEFNVDLTAHRQTETH